MAEDKEDKTRTKHHPEEDEMVHRWKKHLHHYHQKREEETVSPKETKEPETKNSFLDKEIDIDIKINPRNLFKFSALIALLLFAFFLGRFSVGEVSSEVSLPETPAEEESSGGFFSFITGLFVYQEQPVSASETENTSPLAENTTSPAAAAVPEENTTEETVTEEETEKEVEEPIITSYKKVALAVKDVKTDWKTTWGKITHLDYTIKNNEEGTIKPDYFIMVVEGYDDFEKKIPLPPSSQKIKSKTTISSTATVPQGFAYSELTAGDLQLVDITFTLYDASDRLMTTFKKSYDLSG